jgi:transcriptional regulator NrdR family protein
VFCPNCGSSTGVVHSVPGKYARVRRRECEGCGTRFTTTEKIAPFSMKTPIQALSVKVPSTTLSVPG